VREGREKGGRDIPENNKARWGEGRLGGKGAEWG